MSYQCTISNFTYRFNDLKTLLAKASPLRSGDVLASIAADSANEKVASQIALADVPLKNFLDEALIPYEEDEVTRLIINEHDATAFGTISHFTIGDLRDWLLSDDADNEKLTELTLAFTPEMVAAASKLMRNQDLIAV